jgi:hypothetical protein
MNACKKQKKSSLQPKQGEEKLMYNNMRAIIIMIKGPFGLAYFLAYLKQLMQIH